MKYTAVSTGLSITAAYAKNWLKVDDATDNTLITDLITIAKEIADNFLQNDFRNIYDEEVGIGDDATLIFNLDNTGIQDQSLQLYVLDPGTDIVLAKAHPDKYGTLQLQDTADGNNDYILTLATGVITFESVSVPVSVPVHVLCTFYPLRNPVPPACGSNTSWSPRSETPPPGRRSGLRSHTCRQERTRHR